MAEVDPRKCSVKGCGGTPIGLPEVHVWALGFQPGDHDPAKAAVKLPHCAEHMAAAIADPKSFMDGLELQPVLTDVLRVMGRRYADFRTAKIVALPLSELLNFGQPAGRA